MATVSQPVLVSIAPQRYAFFRRILAACTAVIAHAKHARELYEIRVQLSHLNDRQLDDIGLRRDQIKDITPGWVHTTTK